MRGKDRYTPPPLRAERRAPVDAERILNAAFDGTLDAAGHMKFAELLRSDPKFRERWAQTARSLSRLRAEQPLMEGSRPVDRTDAIMARVERVRGFRAAPVRGRLVGTRVALAAGLGLALVGVAIYARFVDRAGVAPNPPSPPARVAAGPTGAARADRSAAPERRVIDRPPLAIGSERYESDLDFKIKTHVDSPSGGPTTMRVFSLADGRLLLTDFEPYPHAQAWDGRSPEERSWWIRAWTQPAPALPEGWPAGK